MTDHVAFTRTVGERWWVECTCGHREMWRTRRAADIYAHQHVESAAIRAAVVDPSTGRGYSMT